MSPASSTMAQSPLAVQEIPPVQLFMSAPRKSTGAATQADVPPVGSVDDTSRPTASPAAHNDGEGHEMAPIQSAESTLLAVQAATPPVGLVEVSTSPSLSPAAQNDALGHETDSTLFPAGAGETARQASPPWVGFVERST